MKDGVGDNDGEGSGYEVSTAPAPPPPAPLTRILLGIDGEHSFPQSAPAPAHFRIKSAAPRIKGERLLTIMSRGAAPQGCATLQLTFPPFRTRWRLGISRELHGAGH